MVDNTIMKNSTLFEFTNIDRVEIIGLTIRNSKLDFNDIKNRLLLFKNVTLAVVNDLVVHNVTADEK